MIKKNNKSKITIDDLALVIADSFDGLEKRLTNTFKKELGDVKEDIEGVKKEMEGVKNQLAGTNRRIDDFAETKVSKITHKELESRVIFLEKKTKI